MTEGTSSPGTQPSDARLAERTRRIIRAWARGMNARTIAKRFDLSTAWAYWVRSRYGSLIAEHKALLDAKKKGASANA